MGRLQQQWPQMDVYQSTRHNFLDNARGFANHNLCDDKNPLWKDSIETWSNTKQDSGQGIERH